MPLVVDSSIACCWLLPDETSSVADMALDLVAEGGMAVPAIFEYELRNVLLTNERRGRITTEIVTEALTRLQGIPTHVDGTFADADLLQIARSHNLTVYDAAYLELSLRLDLPMATLDVRLAAAAKAEGAALVTVTG